MGSQDYESPRAGAGPGAELKQISRPQGTQAMRPDGAVTGTEVDEIRGGLRTELPWGAEPAGGGGETVLFAANQEEDADTVAAIVGQLA